ncbi:MAG: AAA family ATPase [Deltaproteobacteria bacterium]|nr:AAA family ATPase [Deltaproteobacteria bacterium]MBI3060368.1 AAA family ATPase [Deltaproteobacteria bacterium]
MDKKRVSSGIPGLDPLIEGGFPEGKSYLITGESGTGKSIFCIQFILKGLMEGEKAVYVAVDEKPADILEEAASLGWDLLKYIEQKSLLILDASPLFSSRMGAGKEKEVDVQKTVADLTAYVKRMGASRVVIDPVGPLILSRDSSVRAQEHVRTLVHSLQDTMGTTNLLTSYAIPGITGAGDGAIEEFLVAGVIILSITRVQNRMVRTLLIRKMRGTAIDLMEHQFNIVREKGIVLKPVL